MNLTPLKLIEFVFIKEKQAYVSLFNAYDISSIRQFDTEHCILTLNNQVEYQICGTLRTLTNRWIYSLEKLTNFYHDEIMRPSILVYHNRNGIEPDSVHFDEYQLKQFIYALDPELKNKYPNITI